MKVNPKLCASVQNDEERTQDSLWILTYCGVEIMEQQSSLRRS